MADIQLYDAPWPAEPLGRVASDGSVYSADSSREPVGRVDQQGAVYNQPWPAEPIGRFDEDGNVYDGPWPAEPLGRVDASGAVYRSGLSEPVGRVDPPSVAGGSALLLLFDDGQEPPNKGSLGKVIIGAVAGAAAEAVGDALIDAVQQRGAHPQAHRPVLSGEPRDDCSVERKIRSLDRSTAARPRDRSSAETMVPFRRVVGIAQAHTFDVFWTNDPNRTVATWLDEEASKEDTPATKNQTLVEQRRVLHDTRRFVVVVGGYREYLIKAFRELEMADLILACSDAETLNGLGIPVLDRDWKPGSPTIDYETLHDFATRQEYQLSTAPELLSTNS